MRRIAEPELVRKIIILEWPQLEPQYSQMDTWQHEEDCREKRIAPSIELFPCEAINQAKDSTSEGDTEEEGGWEPPSEAAMAWKQVAADLEKPHQGSSRVATIVLCSYCT
jgi:hypothetical protein